MLQDMKEISMNHFEQTLRIKMMVAISAMKRPQVAENGITRINYF